MATCQHKDLSSMQLDNLLSVERIRYHESVASKKRALEIMCELLATGQNDLDQGQIFSCMLERERLGSTGIGHGVAIPHSRMEGVEKALIAVSVLETGVDYDAIDDEAVDILFALLVPQECTEEHLQILASAAEMFNNDKIRHALREAKDEQAIYDIIANWQPQQLSAQAS